MFRLDIKKNLGGYSSLRGGKALQKVAQRSCRCPIPGNIQGHVWWEVSLPMGGTQTLLPLNPSKTPPMHKIAKGYGLTWVTATFRYWATSTWNFLLFDSYESGLFYLIKVFWVLLFFFFFSALFHSTTCNVSFPEFKSFPWVWARQH